MATYVNPIARRFEVLGRTGYGVVYTDRGNRSTVLKSIALWVDGVGHNGAPMAIEGTIEREAAIYEVLGDHPFITKSFGLELMDAASNTFALKLERAAVGCLRRLVMDDPAPPMATRLRMAADFAEGVAHLHKKRVLWADLSARNTLVFDDYRVKLCDFGGALLPGVYDQAIQLYETRYEPPVHNRDLQHISLMASEIFALGTGLCEITEWRIPYGTPEDEGEIDLCKMRGELPALSDDNPAKEVIMRCWTQYASVSELWEEYTISRTVSERMRELSEEWRPGLPSETHPSRSPATSQVEVS